MLPRFFRRLDQDKSRSLDAGELQQGLAELGLVLDMAEAEGVCRRWDRDGSGTLDLEEFLRALRVRPGWLGQVLSPSYLGGGGGCRVPRGLTCIHTQGLITKRCLLEDPELCVLCPEGLRSLSHPPCFSPPCPGPGKQSLQLRLPS